MPRHGNLIECSSVGQNKSIGILDRVEAVRLFRRTDKEVNIFRHRRSQLVVRNAGKRWGFICWWDTLLRSARVVECFVENEKFLHQVVLEKSNLNPCLNE